MGGDNFASIDKWKNFELLLKRYPIHIYNRKNWKIEKEVFKKADIRYYDLPLLDISSTFIRQSLREGKSVRYMVPENVWQFLEGSNLYKQ